MKTFRKIGLSIIAVLAVAGMTSCGDDDDDEGGSGNVSATLDGSNLGLNYAYWYIDQYNHDMIIEFTSYDPTNISSAPSKINFLSISYSVPSNVTSPESAVLSSGEYNLYVASDVTISDDGWQGETDYRATTNSDCIITRDGNNYTITIDHAKVSGDNPNYKTVKLNYSGKLTQLPEEFQD